MQDTIEYYARIISLGNRAADNEVRGTILNRFLWRNHAALVIFLSISKPDAWRDQ